MRNFLYVSRLRHEYQRRHGFVACDGMHVEVRVVEVRRWGLIPRLRVAPVTGRGTSTRWFTPSEIEWAPRPAEILAA
jgi:hypothetical protein